MDIERRDWALASFVVGVLALVGTVATIFVNGVMNDEAREIAGLKKTQASPAAMATTTISPTSGSTPAIPTSTAETTTVAITEATAIRSGTEFTIVEHASPAARKEPTKLPDRRRPPARQDAQQPPNGTRYYLAKLPSEVDSSVQIVFEEDQ